MSRRSSHDQLVFDTLHLEGSLFVPALLDRAAQGECSLQKLSDYHLPPGISLLEEQGRSFRIAQALWLQFEQQRRRADVAPRKAARDFLLVFLKQALGYETCAPTPAPVSLQDRHYPIDALASPHIPLVVGDPRNPLDFATAEFAIPGASHSHRNSPSRVLQQFLNASDTSLWGFVGNGLRVRLLRDADSLSRPAFLEFDLEKIFQEKRYADFRALWNLLHASRAGASLFSDTSPCVWENWRSEGHDLGTRVRDGLRHGVTHALVVLGNGFLRHPDNQNLIQALEHGDLDAERLHQQILRLIYRFLLLFSVEERGLLHPPTDDPATRRIADIYQRGYSLRRLRERALRRSGFDRHSDLWRGIQIVFRGLAHGEPRLALPALGGLFAPEQCPHLDTALLTNRDLLEVMRSLRWAQSEGRLSPVDYRNMGPEELGSVYESLLELVPNIDLSTLRFGYAGLTDDSSSDGNARKLSGSYYTPDPLVLNLLDTALDPVIAQTLRDHPENPEQALLNLKVIDPACGSGHFLLGGARRIAEHLAEIRACGDAVTTESYRHALRDVIAHCIHGVDRNPMAVELARSALWIESYDPGQPLSFLDHHLQVGDALLGILDLKQLAFGIPADAFKALSGDDKNIARELALQNRKSAKEIAQLSDDQGELRLDVTQQENLLNRLHQIESMPELTLEDCQLKEAAYTDFQESTAQSDLHLACDLILAAFLHAKTTPDDQRTCPTNRDLLTCLRGQHGTHEIIAHAQQLCCNALVFHWPLRFPQVFARGGFDCVLGNPPWEVSQLGEEEYFATKSPVIASLAGDKRKEAIKRLESLNPTLWENYNYDKRVYEAQNTFYRESGRYPLTATGKLNTYPLFAETICRMTKSQGRSGFIVPTGIATDDTTKDFFADLVTQHRLVSLFDFENRDGIFSGVHKSYKFCLMTLGPAEVVQFAFFLLRIAHLDDPDRHFTLSPEDFALINPNTRTCPIFRSKADAELTKKIYSRVPVLIRETRDDQSEQNPWDVSFSQGLFNMTSASHLFRDEPAPERLPLYEAKMMHQFDHRWATYELHPETREPNSRDFRLTEKQNPDLEVTPRYWVEEAEVLARLADAPKILVDAWRNRDEDALLIAYALWIAANLPDSLADMKAGNPDLDIIAQGGPRFQKLPPNWRDPKAMSRCKNHPPLHASELTLLRNTPDLFHATYTLLDQRSPRWLMGWRDITNATNERTVIASVIPRAAAGDTLLLMYPKVSNPKTLACLLADQNSLPHDYSARQKIGGTHLKYHVKKQIPILPPEAYSPADLDFIVPRVLELTYTSHALKPWAEDLGYDGPPYAFDPERRAVLRAELDALYARLYGLTRDDLRYILDPSDTHGPDYPSETFRGLKSNDLSNYGEYRTQRLVLEAWDAAPAI